jgi:hypothetical protein
MEADRERFFMMIVFNMPPADGVQLESDDGAYLFHGKNLWLGKVQVVIKGAMLLSPAGYEVAVSSVCGKPMKICDAEFLPCPLDSAPEDRLAVLRAGFVSLIFEENV